MLRIRKDDHVFIMTGKDKGKTGKVVRVIPEVSRAVVENMNIFKKAVRKSDKYPQGGFVEMERPIHISNLMLLDKKTNKPTRLGAKVLKDGSKLRVGKKSGEVV